MVPNGTTWVSNGPKWPTNGSQRCPNKPQRGPKGVPKGWMDPNGTKWVPERLWDTEPGSKDQLFVSFLADPGPSKGPFLKKVDFEGDPKIVIFGTEATLLSAKNSINPCIKATLGPTSSILEGSGKVCFFCRFPIGEKGAQKSMDEPAGRLLGCKKRPEYSPEVSVLAGWSLGLASRARVIQ